MNTNSDKERLLTAIYAAAFDKTAFETLESIVKQWRGGLNEVCESADITLNGRLALPESVRRSTPEVVELLIDAGADVNLFDATGKTALMYAAERCEPRIATRLLECGADPNLSLKGGGSALYFAARGSIASPNIVECIRVLIAGGADLNIGLQDRVGVIVSTPLIGPSSKGNTAAVLALIDAGADLNFVVPSGTALTHSAEEGQSEVIRVLLERGADPSIVVPMATQRPFQE